jgi:hypothetical protein
MVAMTSKRDMPYVEIVGRMKSVMNVPRSLDAHSPFDCKALRSKVNGDTGSIVLVECNLASHCPCPIGFAGNSRYDPNSI